MHNGEAKIIDLIIKYLKIKEKIRMKEEEADVLRISVIPIAYGRSISGNTCYTSLFYLLFFLEGGGGLYKGPQFASSIKHPSHSCLQRKIDVFFFFLLYCDWSTLGIFAWRIIMQWISDSNIL